MLLKFTKMHGAGNDFVVIDLITQRYKVRSRDIRKLADRHMGIGCDQVLLVEAPNYPDTDFRYRIFNADGSEVEQCGNGARCFARFVYEKKLTTKRAITVETAGGIITLHLKDKQQVEVDMGPPRFQPADIPLRVPLEADSYPLQIGEQTLAVGALSMGNPHAILPVDSVEQTAVETLGPKIEGHEDFPQRVNAGFMEVVSRQEIRLRVYERGAGETLACGSGACAAVVYGIRRGWLNDTVTAHLPGGKLSITWRGPGHNVLMTGPTAVVYEGTIKL
ncbi:MAG: diaminopimelate epimerase [Parahaliea sp.]